MLIVGKPHCLPSLFRKTYATYPANVLFYMAYQVDKCPENFLLETHGSEFESLEAHEYWIPEFVQDRLVQ